MRLKCKICGQDIDTKKPPKEGVNLNFATDSEDIFDAFNMSKEIMTLVSHLMSEHPEEAMKLYAGLISGLYSAFEMPEKEDPDMTL